MAPSPSPSASRTRRWATRAQGPPSILDVASKLLTSCGESFPSPSRSKALKAIDTTSSVSWVFRSNVAARNSEKSIVPEPSESKRSMRSSTSWLSQKMPAFSKPFASSSMLTSPSPFVSNAANASAACERPSCFKCPAMMASAARSKLFCTSKLQSLPKTGRLRLGSSAAGAPRCTHACRNARSAVGRKCGLKRSNSRTNCFASSPTPCQASP
mmetsp:Transcript_6532/g.19423  ORF Transcript_6532/g.19423 Transcript_6532/m.19423 type:complete len:213 (+) Transcript_6532:243-881(+)